MGIHHAGDLARSSGARFRWVLDRQRAAAPDLLPAEWEWGGSPPRGETMRSRFLPVLTVILAALVVWGTFARARKESEIRAWQRQAALNDSLHQIADGRYQRAAVVLERERDLRRTLQDSLPELHRELRDLRADTRDYISTIAHLQDLIAAGAAVESVFVHVSGDTVHQVRFAVHENGVSVQGWTRTPPPVYQLHVQHDPIPLHLVVSQLRDGSWQTNIETAPWVEISSLDTRVLHRPRTWWERNRLWILPVAAVMGWEKLRTAFYR